MSLARMARKKKWRHENYIRIYELCRDGLKLQQVAHALGVELSTLKDWRMSDEAVDYAIERGQSMARKGTSTTFVDQVLERLPPDLRDVWAQLSAVNEESNPEKRADMITEGQGKRARQTLYVHALVHCGFRNLEACRFVGISPHTVVKWKQGDPEFLQLMDSIHEMKKDFCEGALMGLVAGGDSPAILFTNKTLNRDRGYDPKITISHEGSVRHQVDLSQLNLPVKVLEMIQEAVKGKKEEQLGGNPRVLQLPAKVLQSDIQDEEAFDVE